MIKVNTVADLAGTVLDQNEKIDDMTGQLINKNNAIKSLTDLAYQRAEMIESTRRIVRKYGQVNPPKDYDGIRSDYAGMIIELIAVLGIEAG